jgi:hypothetical protein
MILLPWEHVENGIYSRKGLDKHRYASVWYFNDNKYYYNIYDEHRLEMVCDYKTLNYKENYSSIKEIQKIADSVLIKNGWRLINKDDKLIVLL